MALQTTGAISLADIQTEFGGSNPIGLDEYYGVAGGIPASGAIDFADFYGTSSGPSRQLTGLHTVFEDPNQIVKARYIKEGYTWSNTLVQPESISGPVGSCSQPIILTDTTGTDFYELVMIVDNGWGKKPFDYVLYFEPLGNAPVRLGYTPVITSSVNGNPHHAQLGDPARSFLYDWLEISESYITEYTPDITPGLIQMGGSTFYDGTIQQLNVYHTEAVTFNRFVFNSNFYFV